MKRLALAVAAAVVLAAGGYFWKYHASAPDAAPASAKSGASGAAVPGAKGGKGVPGGVPVKVGTVGTATISEELNAVGTLLAAESVMIRPERDGRIAAIHFTEGALVRAGAKLVELDTAEIEAQLAAAGSELTLNRSRLKRAMELHEKKFISAQALDDAREAVNQSAARHAEVRARLDRSAVVAPFEGVAGLRQVSPGAYVKAGQDVARLEGIGTLKVDFRVPEVYAGRIRTGQALAVRLDAWPGETFRGAIYAIEPAVDEATRTLLVRARVPNPGVRLKPGMFARITLVLETRENALVIPEQALLSRGDSRYVYRLVDGKVSLVKVETGLRRPGEVEVRSGLAGGDTIVIDGQLRLKDGAAVAVLPDPRAPGRQ